MQEAQKLYKAYELIRDSKSITCKISSTKKIMMELMQNKKETVAYCNKKMLEEKTEVEEAMQGKHFHEGKTKREILVNEISQYLYWQILVAISKNISYEEFKIEEKIAKILEKVNLEKIGESKEITIKEVVEHDLKQMKQKPYLKEILSKG